VLIYLILFTRGKCACFTYSPSRHDSLYGGNAAMDV
jgi:hypothetical protein